jgi:sulfur-oxidizing protein SoxY
MERPDTRWPALSRRGFIRLASAAAASVCLPPAWADAPVDREHLPLLHVPRATRNGSKVPVVVEMDHPMTPDHHVTCVRVANDGDPISSKGTFHFTPANGRIHLAFQARMHEGASEVTATAECSRHGAFSAHSPIEVAEGAGGCSGAAPVIARTPGEDVAAPVIRIPELVQRGRLVRDELIHPQVKMRHPNRTGLVFRDGRFVPESEPIHLDAMEVFYGPERVSWFALTAALSDDPFITFALVARREGTLRVVVTNNRGQEFEARHDIRFS